MCQSNTNSCGKKVSVRYKISLKIQNISNIADAKTTWRYENYCKNQKYVWVANKSKREGMQKYL